MVGQIKARAQSSSRHEVWGGCFVLEPPVVIVQINTGQEILVDMVDEIGELLHVAGENDNFWSPASSTCFRLD